MNKQTCFCGAIYRTDHDFKSHYGSAMHQNYVHQSLYKKCDVCYMIHPSISFQACCVCKNSICKLCSRRLINSTEKCPFCRSYTFRKHRGSIWDSLTLG